MKNKTENKYEILSFNLIFSQISHKNICDAWEPGEYFNKICMQSFKESRIEKQNG